MGLFFWHSTAASKTWRNLLLLSLRSACSCPAVNCPVSKLRLEYIKGDLHLPELNLWLDPHEPKVGPDKVFVSHAHSDHTAAHREVILSAPTQRLMQARVPGVRQEHVLEWKQPRQVDGLPCT